MASVRASESQAAGATATQRTEARAPFRERLLDFVSICAQLALVIAVALRFRFESQTFQHVLPWIGAGFALHYWLPARLRLPFFVLLSLASTGYALGAGPAQFDWENALIRGGVLVAIGLGLIGICQLPWPWTARIALLATAGAVLAVVRVGFFGDQSLAAVWPLLGALFMFRLIIYVYDLQHERAPVPFSRKLAYFFMLPNAFFYLFPVVDWKKFRRDDASQARARQIYQTGLQSMARGLLHIVLYRVVYYHFYIDASLVADGESLLRFVLCNYALYLRVSGQFHMIVGLLQLFGFDLPRSNHHYFLADSFTDYWRRVNIYWKDFMVKIFYQPLAFRLRGRGPMLPVVAGSAVAFFTTWLLHAYQSYWLRGSTDLGAYFSLQDSLFWAILGVLVIANAIWEVRRGRRRSLVKRFDLRESAFAALRTIGVFATMCVLWSLWASGSVTEWTGIWRHADWVFLQNGAIALLLVGLCKIAVEFLESARGGALTGVVPKGASTSRTFAIAALTVVLPTVALGLLGEPRLHRRVDARTSLVLRSLMSNQPNTADLRAMERGYYENLFDAARGNVVTSGSQAPADWIDFPAIPFLVQTHDQRFWELSPSQRAKLNGFDFSTNALGLRDREYSREKPAGVYRVAMLGSSHLLGWGVGDTENFETLVEARLSRARPDGKTLEILNFGLGGYSAICQLSVIRRKVLPLAPDAIYFVAHAVDPSLCMERLTRLVGSNIPLEDEFLSDIARRSGIHRSMSQLAMLRELQPFAEELTREAYRGVARLTREAGALPVWIYMPRITEGARDDEHVGLLERLAREAGFVTLDLSGVWGDSMVDDLAVAPWDLHPNARGHVMFAERLAAMLRADQRLGFAPPAGTASGGK